MSHIEVEQKFPLADSQAVLQALADLGATWGEPKLQVDRYFNHPSRDFAVTDEAFRIRGVGDSNCVTYKGPKLDATTKSRREIEIPFAPCPASAKQFAAMLLLLSFREAGTVRKHRRQASLSWQGQDVEVMLDEVTNLGSFIELEIGAEEANVPAAKEALKTLAEHLGLTTSERRSYLELILNQD